MAEPSTRQFITDMLAELQSCEITIRENANIDMIFADIEEIFDGTYLSILSVLGEMSFDPRSDSLNVWASDDVYALDFECIDDSQAYSQIIADCVRISRGALSFDAVESEVDFKSGSASVELSFRGEGARFSLRFDNDWADTRILDIMARYLAKTDSTKRFFCKDTGQGCLLICKAPDIQEKLSQVTGLAFKPLLED